MSNRKWIKVLKGAGESVRSRPSAAGILPPRPSWHLDWDVQGYGRSIRASASRVSDAMGCSDLLFTDAGDNETDRDPSRGCESQRAKRVTSDVLSSILNAVLDGIPSAFQEPSCGDPAVLQPLYNRRLSNVIFGSGANFWERAKMGEWPDSFRLKSCLQAAISTQRLWCCAFGGT